MKFEDFNLLPLHDAIFDHAEIYWKRKIFRLYIHMFAQGVNVSATPHLLEFQNVTSSNFPHDEPWGPSFQINNASYSNGQFHIQMSSGDTIIISATSFTLTPSDHLSDGSTA